MKTPEQIARGAAERMIHAETGHKGPERHLWIGNTHETSFLHREDCLRAVELLRREAVPFILAAVEEALYSCPVPGGVSGERLAEIEAKDELKPWGRAERRKIVADLLAHIRHVHRMAHGPEAEDLRAVEAAARREGYRRGWREGAEAQRKMCGEAAASQAKMTAFGEGEVLVASAVADRAAGCPLAECPEGGG